MVDETLGVWRLTEGIGRGGMGEVYAAEYDYTHLFSMHAGPERREEVGREVAGLPREEQARLARRLLGIELPAEARFAIKICNARSGTPGYKRFLQEAEVAQRLGDHPYIVTVHAVNGIHDAEGSGLYKRLQLDRGKYRDVAFMVMDLASCTFDRLRLTIGEAVHIVRCIANALDHAHAQGIIHRDLKPENILGSVDHPLLTDFGIAKEMDASEGLTRTGQIIGTLDYMSPEQATDAKHVDNRSDIYSLGVVLYEFATQGCLPYAHKADRESCLAAIRSEDYEPKWPREHRPGFPAELERVILKAMAFRKEDRYQTMAEFISDLDRFTRGERIGWLGRIPVRSMLRFQMRHHPRLVWGGGALVLLPLVVAGVVRFTHWIDRDRQVFEDNLGTLDAALAEIQAGRRLQLNRAEDEALAKVAPLRQAKDYQQLRERLAGIEDRLLACRGLRAVFRPDRQRNETPQADALDELKLAARVASPAWHATDEGLQIRDQDEVTLHPYGKGTVGLWLVMALPASLVQSGQAVELARLQEVEYPSHRSRWVLQGDLLSFSMQEDEKPPVLLRQERLTSLRISLAVELGQARVRTWVGTAPGLHPVPGLREGSPARITLQLPAGTVLERIELRPRAWK